MKTECLMMSWYGLHKLPLVIFGIYTLFYKHNIYKHIYILTVCSCHVTYAFESESTLYSCLNVKELLARSRREIWRWSDCNWTRTQNHLALKRTLNRLAKLAKRLSVCLRAKWFWVRVQLQSYIYRQQFLKPEHKLIYPHTGK